MTRAGERAVRVAGRACSLLLVLATLLVYAPAARHEFVSYDDPDYVVDNPHVNRGLSWEGVRWSLTESHASNWHPLAWLSHMLDVEVFGLDAGKHHLVNVALHAANAVLLLLALRSLTGALWPSALVAALFALHPLRVESVAWIAERKDLLAGSFFFLLLLAHARHARFQSASSFALVLAVFALGLLAKPMLVTAPFVLLLLDLWPLGRLASRHPARDLPSLAPTHPPSLAPGHPGARRAEGHPGKTGLGRRGYRLLLEKVPLLLLAALSCAITLRSQQQGGSLYTLEAIPFASRLANAPAACVLYLQRFFWPAGLASFYPHPALVEPGRAPWNAGAIAALVLLLLASALALACLRSRPWLFVGWCWFLGMLVPVIGLVQVGEQALADRYAYLPLIGIQIALVWSGADLVRRWPALRLPLALASAGALGALALAARSQLRCWKDSGALYERAIAVTERNYAARVGLASVRLRAGGVRDARRLLEEALAIHPRYAPALYDLALLEQQQGNAERAIDLYREALASLPDLAAAHLNLGVLLAERGEVVDAALEFERVLALAPDHPDAHFDLGQLLLAHGQVDEAIAHLEQAVGVRPEFTAAWEKLGSAYEALGRHAPALRALRRAAADPARRPAAVLLAWILGTASEDELRDGAEARRWAELAVRASDRADPDALEALAAALAEQGDFARAAEIQREAIELLPPGRQAQARQRLERYRSSEPVRHAH